MIHDKKNFKICFYSVPFIKRYNWDSPPKKSKENKRSKKLFAWAKKKAFISTARPNLLVHSADNS